MSQATAVLDTIQVFLRRANKESDIDSGTPLFGDGIGLDSLETAELSALLEDTHGTDPFSEGEVPETVGGILAFYDKAA